MKRSHRVGLFAFALAASGLSNGHAAAVLNGSFESPANVTGQSFPSYCYTAFSCTSALDDWSGSYVVIQSGNSSWGSVLAQDGNQYVGLQFTQAVTQTLASLTAGSTYTLHWYDAGRPQSVFGPGGNQTYDVLLNDVLLPGGTFSVHTGDPFTARSLAFTAGATNTLTFAGTVTGVDATVFLDNVSITAAVPEPAEWAMLAAGLALVGAVARRRATRLG